jgi:MoaA/NifB/PqqE/SkfB family radical SAM enzyme
MTSHGEVAKLLDHQLLGKFRSVGWSLGNACPYSCAHCYSRSMRVATNGLTVGLIDDIVHQLDELGVQTVTLGGNEPIFTNGLSLEHSLLPEIVLALRARSIRVALVTSGPSATALRRISARAFSELDMIFVSLDAPTADRHNANRGAELFQHALRALLAARDAGIDRSILYCAHRGNFKPADVDQLVELSYSQSARVRINTLKPTGQDSDRLLLRPEEYWAGFSRLLKQCRTDLVDEPVLRELLGLDASGGCPCGSSTFRISHAQHDGAIPLTPCIYAANHRFGDVRESQIQQLVADDLFRRFASYSCKGCKAQALLDPEGRGRDSNYDLVDRGWRICEQGLKEDMNLRERYGGYLCTWMGSVR